MSVATANPTAGVCQALAMTPVIMQQVCLRKLAVLTVKTGHSVASCQLAELPSHRHLQPWRDRDVPVDGYRMLHDWPKSRVVPAISGHTKTL